MNYTHIVCTETLGCNDFYLSNKANMELERARLQRTIMRGIIYLPGWLKFEFYTAKFNFFYNSPYPFVNPIYSLGD